VSTRVLDEPPGVAGAGADLGLVRVQREDPVGVLAQRLVGGVGLVGGGSSASIADAAVGPGFTRAAYPSCITSASVGSGGRMAYSSLPTGRGTNGTCDLVGDDAWCPT